MSESAFRQRKVVPFLKTLPNTVWMSVTQQNKSGDPDFVLCVNSYFVALEIKDSQGRLTVLQCHKLDLIEQARGFSFVACPSNWPEIRNMLLSIAKGDFDFIPYWRDSCDRKFIPRTMRRDDAQNNRGKRKNRKPVHEHVSEQAGGIPM